MIPDRRTQNLLKEISGLNHLHFSERARKRIRRRRRRAQLAVAGWATLAALAVVGVRAPDPASELMGAFENALTRDGSDLEASANFAGATRFVRKAVVTARPTPTPTPKETATPEDTATPDPTNTPLEEASGTYSPIEAAIRAAAEEFGIPADYLVSVALCESTLNPTAVSPSGKYHGLFQYDYQTWNAFGYGDIYDPVAQSRTTARLLASGHHSRWPNCA